MVASLPCWLTSEQLDFGDAFSASAIFGDKLKGICFWVCRVNFCPYTSLHSVITTLLLANWSSVQDYEDVDAAMMAVVMDMRERHAQLSTSLPETSLENQGYLHLHEILTLAYNF